MPTFTLTSQSPHVTADSTGKNIWPRSNEISVKLLVINFSNMLNVERTALECCKSVQRKYSI